MNQMLIKINGFPSLSESGEILEPPTQTMVSRDNSLPVYNWKKKRAGHKNQDDDDERTWSVPRCPPQVWPLLPQSQVDS